MEKADYSGSFLPTEGTRTDAQSFTPRPVEPPKPPMRLRRRKLRSLRGLDDAAKNRYEAVLIAAARARQLNAKKVALEERGMEDEVAELKRLKMTTFALDEVLDGKIVVIRPEDTIDG
jgi:DNA-directed RNA polymerase omega subunit